MTVTTTSTDIIIIIMWADTERGRNARMKKKCNVDASTITMESRQRNICFVACGYGCWTIKVAEIDANAMEMWMNRQRRKPFRRFFFCYLLMGWNKSLLFRSDGIFFCAVWLHNNTAPSSVHRWIYFALFAANTNSLPSNTCRYTCAVVMSLWTVCFLWTWRQWRWCAPNEKKIQLIFFSHNSRFGY